MVAHSQLTGSALHEPKGAASASQYTVYVSDGAGSGSWQKIDVNSIDNSNIFNVNTYFSTHTIADISTSTKIYIPTTRAVQIDAITSVLHGTITTANSTINIKNAAGASMGTITVNYSGSGPGDIDTLVVTTNNLIAANSFFTIETDGGSDTTMPITFTVEYTLTS